MALAPHPDILRCANKWRHGEATLPAVAFVGIADDSGDRFWTPRCQGCANSLAAANPPTVRAHVVDIAPTRERRAEPDRPADDLTYDTADHPAWPDPAP
jgi:hypothetical protein